MSLSPSTMAAVVALLLSGASAHAVMNTPNGFPGLKVQSSPLGQNFAFPCQFGPGAKYDFSNSTKVAAGSNTLLSFIGSAVHGGGSCQVSMAKKPSSDPKDWKVIHTMIGGCPATAAGNLQTSETTNGYPNGPQCKSPDSDETECVKSYNIQIPKEVGSGQYYFSWSWFNKIGNREMYQNCAPLEVTGGASNDDFFNGLPPMFMANVNGRPCSTADVGPNDNALDIPNPGQSVVRSTNPSDATNPGVLGSCKAVYGDAGSNKGNTPASSAPAPAPAASSAPAPSPAAPTATSIVAVTSTAAAQYGNSAPPAANTPAPAPASGTPGQFAPSAGSNSACANPCSTDGALICLPNNTFGLCNFGCAVPQPLAAGTHCVDGAIARRDVQDVFRRHINVHARPFRA